MAKKTATKFLSDIFLAEFSKKSIASFLGLISLPTLLSLLLDSLSTILNTLVKLPIERWQLSVWLFLSSFFLIYTFLIILFSIKAHKSLSLKRKKYFFSYKGYEWEMSLPDMKVPSYPNCPKHHVYLSVYVGNKNPHVQKCPFCDVSFPAEDYATTCSEARHVGIAMYEGRYKK